MPVMKTKPVTPREFLNQWEDLVQRSILPERIVEEKRPDIILEGWGDDLPAHRERLRDEVDILVRRIMASRTDDDIGPLLSGTDPEIVAILYDRVKNAGKELRVAVHLRAGDRWKKAVTWRDIVKELLLRGTFH